MSRALCSMNRRAASIFCFVTERRTALGSTR